MLINKTLIILLISLITFAGFSLFLNNNGIDANNKEEILLNISNASNSLQVMAKKYFKLNLGFSSFDLVKPILLVCAGTILVIGIDFAMRRRLSNVIKRFRSQIKNR